MTSTTGAELFPILRKVISRLIRLGLRIMTVTCDGASEKRLLFSLHDEKNDKSAYKIKNVYTNEGNPQLLLKRKIVGKYCKFYYSHAPIVLVYKLLPTYIL